MAILCLPYSSLLTFDLSTALSLNGYLLGPQWPSFSPWLGLFLYLPLFFSHWISSVSLRPSLFFLNNYLHCTLLLTFCLSLAIFLTFNGYLLYGSFYPQPSLSSRGYLPFSVWLSLTQWLSLLLIMTLYYPTVYYYQSIFISLAISVSFSQ